MEILIAILGIGGAILLIAPWVLIATSYLQQRNELQNKPQKDLQLTYNEVNEIIEGIIMEIFTNKYLLYYKLKDIRIIPNMDQEITNITKEIINAFSDTFIHACHSYYSNDFLVMMITRKVQILLVDYTNNNKPNTK